MPVVLPQSIHDGPPVDVGKLHVQDDAARPELLRERQTLLAAGGDQDLQSPGTNDLDELPFVSDYLEAQVGDGLRDEVVIQFLRIVNLVAVGIAYVSSERTVEAAFDSVQRSSRLADATGRAVLLIPGARGDTSFTPKNGYTWDGNDRSTRVNLYRRGVAAIDAALARYPGSHVAAILWHQGETDVPLMSPSAYQEKLDSLIDDLRARYGADVPFVLGQMVPEEMELSGKPYAGIDAVHQDTPNRRHRTAFAPGPRSSFNSDVDRHYSGAGLRELAERMWSAYSAMCPDELDGYRSDGQRRGR